MKSKKVRVLIGLALVTILALTLFGCAGGMSQEEGDVSQEEYDEVVAELAELDLDDAKGEIEAAIDGVKADMSALEAAADIIHAETDVILEGDAPLPDEMLDMTEAVHMSSHAHKLLAIHMNVYIDKLNVYKSDPEKNRGKILVVVGKIESLLKIFVEAVSTTDFSGWMEWPYTEKSPHDTVHILIEDEDIKASSDYKSAADAMHEAMHAFDDAGGSMRLQLEDLEDLVKTAGNVP
jgi:hypothetical protein